MVRTSMWLLSIGLLWTAVTPAANAQVDAINGTTPWRAYLVQGANLLRDKGNLIVAPYRGKPEPCDPGTANLAKYGFTRLPQANWNKSDFDEGTWPRYLVDDLYDFVGDYGIPVGGGSGGPTLLYLRTSFGIADPGHVADLKLTVTCLGGGVVYVNGEEIGRGFMPAGAIYPLSPAEDYAIDCYTADDGTTPLPIVQNFQQPDAKWAARYKQRVRTFTVLIPQRVLVKGRNVVAIELHRCAVAGPLPRMGAGMWSHLGLHKITLTSASGAGVIAYAQAIAGTHAWSAAAEEVITDTLPEKSLVRRSTFKTMLWSRGEPVRGISIGNPFDPILPVRMSSPRNGVCSGQAILSDPAGLNDIRAELGSLKGPSGATVPATAVKIRYAVQHARIHYCDALMTAPPQTAKTVPVWLILEIPKDQTPGWYTAVLSLRANGKTFTVPVQALVTGATLPASRDFSSLLHVSQSPETIAAQYKVTPWSPEHFRLLEPSLAMMGQVGNDVIQVSVITRNQFRWQLPLIRFTKEGENLRPDFSTLNTYLDFYSKHCAPPKALVLYIWDPSIAERVANSYENRQIDSREFKPSQPLTVLLTDGATEAKAPQIGAPGSEAFYRALIGGVKDIVEKRGWPASCIMLGLGGDMRPSKEHGELMRQWAPYARWSLLSHFSGDPGAFYKGTGPSDAKIVAYKAGKLIGIGDLEVGLKEHPWSGPWPGWTANQFEKVLANPTEYLDIGTCRWIWQDYSPPIVFRTMPPAWARISRVGLDFWGSNGCKAVNTSYFTQTSALAVPGPEGAVPSVRWQALREGVQDMEVRLSIMQAYAKMPAADQKQYRDLLDECVKRVGSGLPVSQMELIYDWPAYIAQVQQTAADLAGVKTDAKWEQPPAK